MKKILAIFIPTIDDLSIKLAVTVLIICVIINDITYSTKPHRRGLHFSTNNKKKQQNYYILVKFPEIQSRKTMIVQKYKELQFFNIKRQKITT